MARDNTWTNNDGLKIGFGTLDTTNDQAGEVHTKGISKELVKVLNDASTVADTDTAAVQGDEYPIPADAIIQRAYFVVDTAFAGATAVLDIGVKQKDGTNIDDDGIDSAIDVTSLTAGAVIECDGALVGAEVGANDAYIMFTYDTAAFTAGAGRLYIEYIA